MTTALEGRGLWESWLEDHFLQAPEIYIQMDKKSSKEGRKTIWWTRNFWQSSDISRRCTRGRSKDRLLELNIGKLSECSEVWWGRLRPIRNYFWFGMSSTIGRLSSNKSATKWKLWKMWVQCWMGQRPWRQRKQRRQRHWMPSLLNSLPLPALRNHGLKIRLEII